MCVRSVLFLAMFSMIGLAAEENLKASEVQEFTLTIYGKDYEFRYIIKRSGEASLGFATTPFSPLKIDEKQNKIIWALVDELDEALTVQSKSKYGSGKPEYLLEFRSKDKSKCLLIAEQEKEDAAPKPLRELAMVCSGLVKW